MGYEATCEKMKTMRLHGMLRAFQTTMETGKKRELTTDELLAYMVDAEWDDRDNRKMNRLLKSARLRYQASIEQTDFTLPRNLDKNMFIRLADCQWIASSQNIIIIGPTGLGKSYLACALGHQACLRGYRVAYFNCSKLYARLKMSKADGTYSKEVNRLQRQDLIIIDDFGLEHLDDKTRLALLEILEDRHGISSTIITTQLPVKVWDEVIGDATIADAICDRLVHNAHRINLKGEVSIREIQAKRLTKPAIPALKKKGNANG